MPGPAIVLLSLFPSLVLSLAPASPRQEVAAPRCAECGGAGLLPCPAHRAADLDPARRATYCRTAAGCATCAGAEWLDCPACAGGAAEAWLAARAAEAPAAAERAAEIEKELGRPLRIAESSHFLLVCELAPRKLGRTKLDEHGLLHAWLDRLESLFADYCACLGAREEEFGARSWVLLWQERADHDAAGEEYCGWTWEQPWLYQRGARSRFSLHAGDKRYRDDADLHRTVVHHVVHGIMNQQKPAAWTGDSPDAWADVGLAHWFEDRLFGRADVACASEVEPALPRADKWRATVRKLAAAGKAPPIEALEPKKTGELTGDEHALAFAWIDFLMATDPAQLNVLLQRFRARTPIRDAIQEIYGWKLPALDAAWRAWVLASYAGR
ncbi:MAG: hypothetical protein AB1726_04155 [Planctomycetota bacterium]